MAHALTARAPTRVDLAGGTLDIWPLNMLVESALTINVAIDLWATVTLEEVGPGGDPARAVIVSEDQGLEETWERAAAPPASARLPLVAACARYLAPERGFRMTTRCASPAGAGLGGSSALAIGILGAVQTFLGRPMMPPDRLVRIARDLEAGVLEIPTGTQDHFAAAFGGAAAIRHGAGGPTREELRIDLEKLAARLIVCFTGASRLSARANWDMIRRILDGDPAARRGLHGIAAIAVDMRAALLEENLDATASLLRREWEQRKTLSPQVSTAGIEACLEAALSAGALAGKVCGAGGGGCVAILCREGGRERVTAALEALRSDGIRVLPARPTRAGLQLAR